MTTPADIPVTNPVVEPIVAIKGLLLLQVPVPVASVSVTVKPTQTALGPVITAGNGLMVIVLVPMHPNDETHVMISVPADTPVTMPVKEPMVAIAVVPLLHVPVGMEV